MRLLFLFLILFLPYIGPGLLTKLDDKYAIKNNLPVFIINFLVIIGIYLYFPTIKDNLLLAIFLPIIISLEYCAAIMDQRYKEVYDFLHYIAILSEIIILIFVSRSSILLTPIIVMIILSLALSLVYGFSDALAFIVQALYSEIIAEQITTANNLLMSKYHYLLFSLIVFLVSYILFFIVQLLRRNINRYGNCKIAAAFIPYIYVSTIISPFIILSSIRFLT